MPKNLLHRAFAHTLVAICFLLLLQTSNHARQDNSTRRFARTYDALHYVIRTSFDVPRKTVIGQVDLTLKPLAAGFKSFELDAADMKVEQVTDNSGKRMRSFQQDERLRITLDREYGPSESITVSIHYRARPRRGLYFVSAQRDGDIRRPAQIWTQGQPEENHHWFPCYDFPDDKATTEQFITTTHGQMAIANGTLVSSAMKPDGTRTFHWRMDQPHSTYLTSLVVGDYVKLADNFNNIPLEYYTYRGTEETARKAFDTTPEMMGFFIRALKYEFPFERYAQTIVGDFEFGGMENITATTYADSEILSVNMDGPDFVTENLVSHELAHSWFGNLVTCRDWSHLWLNEGFATFMEAAFREQQNGREAYLALLQENAQQYFSEDPSRKRHPLVNPRYPLSMELFDETTYKKGAYVVHMLRETVGDAMFWKTLNIYLNKFKHKTVETRDLQHTFESVTGQNLDWFFDQWIYRAGYPELRVRSSYNPARKELVLNISQTQKPDGNTPQVFRLPVEIEIITPSVMVTEQIEINQRAASFTFKLESRPLVIVFDSGARILKKLDFPQPRALAAYHLVDGADLRAKRKALEALSLSSDKEIAQGFSSDERRLTFGLQGFSVVGRMAENSMR